MTMAWANWCGGGVIRAVQANAAGVAWGLASLWLMPWTLVSGLRGAGAGDRSTNGSPWAWSWSWA